MNQQTITLNFKSTNNTKIITEGKELIEEHCKCMGWRFLLSRLSQWLESIDLSWEYQIFEPHSCSRNYGMLHLKMKEYWNRVLLIITDWKGNSIIFKSKLTKRRSFSEEALDGNLKSIKFEFIRDCFLHLNNINSVFPGDHGQREVSSPFKMCFRE